MAGTVRIKRHIVSETLHVPELRELLGRDVEIEIREVATSAPRNERYPLRGSVVRYDDPTGPVSEEDWEATA